MLYDGDYLFQVFKNFLSQFQFISPEVNVYQKLTPGIVRPCFESKESLLVSKYWLLVLSKTQESGCSFKFISTLTRVM